MGTWHKMTDRKPTQDQVVWYYYHITGVCHGTYKLIHDAELGDVDCFSGEKGFLCDDVTHWMPKGDETEAPSAPSDENDETNRCNRSGCGCIGCLRKSEEHGSICSKCFDELILFASTLLEEVDIDHFLSTKPGTHDIVQKHAVDEMNTLFPFVVPGQSRWM